jgi:hypothetical protein
MELTPRLALPTLIPGQAQKEFFHNEALQLLDCIVAAAIEEPARNDPPLSPSAGQTYLIGTSPTGEWTDYPDHLAAFGAGGWRFVVPVVGLRVIEKSSGTVAAYGAAGWEMGVVRASRIIVDGQQVVGPQGGAIADPAGGTTVDLEARSTITEILSALRQHGLISG